MLLLNVIKSTKDVAAKCNFARNSLHGRKIKKNLRHIENLNYKLIKSKC